MMCWKNSQICRHFLLISKGSGRSRYFHGPLCGSSFSACEKERKARKYDDELCGYGQVETDEQVLFECNLYEKSKEDGEA